MKYITCQKFFQKKIKNDRSPAKKGRLFWIKKVIDNSAGPITIEIDYLKLMKINVSIDFNPFSRLKSIAARHNNFAKHFGIDSYFPRKEY